VKFDRQGEFQVPLQNPQHDNERDVVVKPAAANRSSNDAHPACRQAHLRFGQKLTLQPLIALVETIRLRC
jgi:hypothetical protein